MFDDGSFEIDAGGPVAFTDDIERPLRGRKKALAFQLSAMGAPTMNFYNDAYSRIGFAEPARRVRDLWMAGRRGEAADAVPDEMAMRTSFFGTDDMVRDRIRAYRDAGVVVPAPPADGSARRRRSSTRSATCSTSCAKSTRSR